MRKRPDGSTTRQALESAQRPGEPLRWAFWESPRGHGYGKRIDLRSLLSRRLDKGEVFEKVSPQTKVSKSFSVQFTLRCGLSVSLSAVDDRGWGNEVPRVREGDKGNTKKEKTGLVAGPGVPPAQRERKPEQTRPETASPWEAALGNATHESLIMPCFYGERADCVLCVLFSELCLGMASLPGRIRGRNLPLTLGLSF